MALCRTPKSLPSDTMKPEPRKRAGHGALLLAMCVGLLMGHGSWTFTSAKMRVPRSLVPRSSTAADFVIKFGRYKYKTLEQVQNEDPDFVELVRGTSPTEASRGMQEMQQFLESLEVEGPDDSIAEVAEASDFEKPAPASPFKTPSASPFKTPSASPFKTPSAESAAAPVFKKPAAAASHFKTASAAAAAPAGRAAPAVRGSPVRTPTPTGLNADFFEIPRGFFEGRQIWSCQGYEWAYSDGDPYCSGARDGWRKVVRVIEGRRLVVNMQGRTATPHELGDENCEAIEESDLTNEQYAKYVSSLMEFESEQDPRPPKLTKLKSGKSAEFMRKFEFRGVSLDGKPYIAPTMRTEAYAGESQHLGGNRLEDAQSLVGLRVRPLGPPQPWFMGLVVCDDEPETLTEARRAELMKAKTPEVRIATEKAPAGELIVKVSKNCTNEKYDLKMSFVTSALRPCLTGKAQEEKLQRVKNWEGWQAIAPTEMIVRSLERQTEIKDEVVRLLESIFPGKGSSIKRLSSGPVFRKLPPPTLVFGKGHRLQADGKATQVTQAIRNKGPFEINPEAPPVQLHAILLGQATPQEKQGALKVWQSMQQTLVKLNAVTRSTPTEKGLTEVGSTREDVVKAFKYGPDDAVLVFLTKSTARSEHHLLEEVKVQSLRSGLKAGHTRHTASQGFDMVGKSALWNPASTSLKWAMDVCNSGMLAKLGHTPWALDYSSWLSDPKRQVAVIGYDVSHQLGSHYAAGVRVSGQGGDRILSKITPVVQRVHGEIVPPKALATLIPAEFARERVVFIHRDGKFTKDEERSLEQHHQTIGGNTAFVLIEIIKHAGGTPRIYNKVVSPDPGSMLVLSQREVILASSKDLFQGTANPLNIRLKHVFGDASAIDMENFAWAKTVFELSYLHHGSIAKRPRLPITTHAADDVAGIYASAGQSFEISMELTDGFQQYWL